jgi:Thiamine pyrophosphate enzyme, N-terminal TPP binding domain
MHGAGGRRRQPCFGTAGPVSRTHPGRRSDRAQAAGVPAPQCLSGDLHAPLFAAVTKFSTTVDLTSELPRLLRHAWRAALADTPRPTHLDFSGHQELSRAVRDHNAGRARSRRHARRAPIDCGRRWGSAAPRDRTRGGASARHSPRPAREAAAARFVRSKRARGQARSITQRRIRHPLGCC